MGVITLFISVLVVSVGAVDIINRCDKIPLGTVNYDDWIRFSPFFFYRSTEVEYQCTTVSFVGPAGTDTNYTGTTIIVNGNKTLTYDLTLANSSFVQVEQCSSGVRGGYSVLFSNMYGPGNASACVFICDSQGVNIIMLACSGRTPQDEAYIQNYLDTKLKVPIIRQVFNTQLNCPNRKYCVAYS